MQQTLTKSLILFISGVYVLAMVQPNLQNDLALSDFKIADSLFICGDHLLNGSINAAFKSGRLVAEAMSQ